MVNLQPERQDLKHGAQNTGGYHKTKKQTYPSTFSYLKI